MNQPQVSIARLLMDPMVDTSLTVRLLQNDFSEQELRTEILSKARLLLDDLSTEYEGMSTPEKSNRQDKQAKWAAISGQPTLLDTLGKVMLRILVVDVYLDILQLGFN
ncbi:hypothetical protein LTR36_006956 [Oleoguttula mirabilis]|uniref:Uncharacterized protein n=1 Tax=Oleoguttula mirabilis TaxID=1507867 RepID=A0AAV9JBX1_9PEZI|nr:hypothetical protein LTR36_006956 [Oleoguttula mirabilis]